MPCFHSLRMIFSIASINYISADLLPHYRNAYMNIHPRSAQCNHRMLMQQNISPSSGQCCLMNDDMDSTKKGAMNSGGIVYGGNDSPETARKESEKERQRRKKIGLANKGRVPWNKGKKHSIETRQRIKQRTIEALRDPKVRKRMSEHPHLHSDQVKLKISSSLKRIWEERLKIKNLREKVFVSWAQSIANSAKKGGIAEEELDWDSHNEIKQNLMQQEILWALEKAKAKAMGRMEADKFFWSWTESIAKAAKKGGISEEELRWDGYDKMKQDIVIQNLKQAAEKVRAKEIEQSKAETAAQIKAIKRMILTQKRKDKEVNIKERKTKRTVCRKEKEEKDDPEVAQGVKCNQRLYKNHIWKYINGQLSKEEGALSLHFPALEKLDLELIKREKFRQEVSLEDQIRDARNKKAESKVR